jgi:hypothetical protein
LNVATIPFRPSPDVAAILNDLLDAYERRSGEPKRAIRCQLDSLAPLSYHSQVDPAPRQVANEQLQALEQAGLVQLTWLPGEPGHLLHSVTLLPGRALDAFKLVSRVPVRDQRARLSQTLLGERFRFRDWRLRAIDYVLEQLRVEMSPAPFSLSDHEFNRDLLTALAALDDVGEETPHRVFSVRIFNDSKRFDNLRSAVASLGRRHQPEWRGLTKDEVLRELNLVANPGHLYLHGAWRLVDAAGQVMLLGEFHPSVGIPAAQAGRLARVEVATVPVICVENPTSFYELVRLAPAPVCAVCLWGNPGPACRHLLRRLPGGTPLQVWADIDYGGLSILAQLREQVSPAAWPYLMDVQTLEAHSRWARPLSAADATNLARLLHRPSLADVQPLIQHMLQRGLKLEQEAINLVF